VFDPTPPGPRVESLRTCSPKVIHMTWKYSVRSQAHVSGPIGIPRSYLIDILGDCRPSVPILIAGSLGRSDQTNPIGQRSPNRELGGEPVPSTIWLPCRWQLLTTHSASGRRAVPLGRPASCRVATSRPKDPLSRLYAVILILAVERIAHSVRARPGMAPRVGDRDDHPRPIAGSVGRFSAPSLHRLETVR
jgi:hypothetical protein